MYVWECVARYVNVLRVCDHPPRRSGSEARPGVVAGASSVGLCSPWGSSNPHPPRVSPAGLGGKMGSRGLGLALACCLLLAFACGLVLGRVPRGQQEQEEQEGTREPPMDHAER